MSHVKKIYSGVRRSMSSIISNNVSAQQVQQLDDQIPVVDRNDLVLRSGTKRECHARPEERDKEGVLHRAFSVFLFNSRKELLLQQRSPSKITFPNYFTNSCCSHPRFNKDELDDDNHLGIKIAAQRRLKFELGISADEVLTFILTIL